MYTMNFFWTFRELFFYVRCVKAGIQRMHSIGFFVEAAYQLGNTSFRTITEVKQR